MENLPLCFSGTTLFFSACALGVSILAYRHSKNRMRLELFDKRWEIYEPVWIFGSRVMRHGSLTINDNNEEDVRLALDAAVNSFRGIGWHKTRMLFGKDIHELFESVNNKYAYLVAFNEAPSDPTRREEWVEKRFNALNDISELMVKLPEHFNKYMYFGDCKK